MQWRGEDRKAMAKQRGAARQIDKAPKSLGEAKQGEVTGAMFINDKGRYFIASRGCGKTITQLILTVKYMHDVLHCISDEEYQCIMQDIHETFGI